MRDFVSHRPGPTVRRRRHWSRALRAVLAHRRLLLLLGIVHLRSRSLSGFTGTTPVRCSGTLTTRSRGRSQAAAAGRRGPQTRSWRLRAPLTWGDRGRALMGPGSIRILGAECSIAGCAAGGAGRSGSSSLLSAAPSAFPAAAHEHGTAGRGAPIPISYGGTVGLSGRRAVAVAAVVLTSLGAGSAAGAAAASPGASGCAWGQRLPSGAAPSAVLRQPGVHQHPADATGELARDRPRCLHG